MSRRCVSTRAGALVALCVGPWWLGGCGAGQPQQLSGSAFLPTAHAAATSGAAKPVMQARPPVPVPTVQPVEPPASAATTEPAAPPLAGSTASAGAVSPAELSAEPTTAGVSPLTSAPATQPAAAAVADAADAPAGPSYMTLGGIVAEVNGTPIYAHNLLAPLNAELAAKSREMDIETFRSFAKGELSRQREVLIDDEAEFAAAQLLLSDEDKKLAEQITVQNRKKLVTASGGSVELARRKVAADAGTPSDAADFDDAMKQQYRRIMQQVFYQRKVVPRIQVTAADMRDFYDAHVDRLYSEKSEAQFRVIKIDPQRIGGPDAETSAKQRIAEIRDRAIKGEDFATLASNENQDAWLKSRAGDPGGWMQRNSYRIDAVDRAVWQIQPGQLTPIVESDGAFYVAKLEARKDGRTRPFDDAAVQDDVHNRLWEQQYAELRGSVLAELENEAVVRKSEAMLGPAMDMVMQEYARWHPVAVAR